MYIYIFQYLIFYPQGDYTGPGKYGWIRPTVPVEHPQAARRQAGRYFRGTLVISSPDMVKCCDFIMTNEHIY